MTAVSPARCSCGSVVCPRPRVQAVPTPCSLPYARGKSAHDALPAGCYGAKGRSFRLRGKGSFPSYSLQCRHSASARPLRCGPCGVLRPWPGWAGGRQAMGPSEYDPGFRDRKPWNAGRKLGAKRALKPQQVWAIRFWLDQERRVRDRAMFDLAVDSKLRGCDIVKIRVGDLVSGGRVRSRAIVIQRKTGHLVQFELLEPARASVLAWLVCRGGTLDDFAFPSRISRCSHQHLPV